MFSTETVENFERILSESLVSKEFPASLFFEQYSPLRDCPMQKIALGLLFVSASLSLHAAPSSPPSQEDYTKLQANLLCEHNLPLGKLTSLVASLNGHMLENRSGSYRGTYTIPFGFYILNQPITEFNITRALNANGNYVYRYQTPIPNLSPSEVAALLNIPQNMETKLYSKNNLSIQIANGQTVLICTK